MKYSSAHTNQKNEFIKYYQTQTGKIKIEASNNNITEHIPNSFYANNNQTINSYAKLENNILSFYLDNYDNTQEVIIDPWVVSETANSGNSTSAVWEVETDASGNVYTISNEDHMQLKKYNSAGTLQWTYNTPWDTSTVWIGTLATDGGGTSYVTSGTEPQMERIDVNGNMIWHKDWGVPLGETAEWWSITFNCDKTKLIVGGTYIPSAMQFDYYASIYNMDLTNGDVLSHVELAYTDVSGFGNMPEEVRSIAPTNNSKYVFLTHKQVGIINQNIGECPIDEPDFQVSNQEQLAYKCENYLPYTQNGGGLKALIANDNYFYTHAGDEIRQWDVTNGNLINTATIPGGSAGSALGSTVVHNSGLSVDDAGNVYAGSDGQVVKFDENLNVLQTTNVNFTVYDVSVNSNGEVIACGAQLDNDTNIHNRFGKVEAVNLGSSGQYIATCCDVNICHPDTLCSTDSPITISISSPGGTFSGTGITDTNNGIFDPAVSGVGTFTITYSKPCGSESVDIVVLSCTPIDVCDDGTNYTASGGSGTINWYDWESVSITTEAQCTSCGGTWNPGFPPLVPASCDISSCDAWAQIGTGTTLDPSTINSWPLMITDGIDTVIYNSASEVPPCSACTNPTLSETHIDVTCQGGNDASIDLTITPGSGSSYSSSWSNGASTEDISGLSAGTYTVTVTDDADAHCSATLSVTINDGAPPSTNTVNASVCSGQSYTYADGTIHTNITANETYVSTLVGAAASGCDSIVTENITVNSNPTVNVTGNDFCTGFNTTLDAGAGYTSYTWSPGGFTTQQINVLTANTYNVTVIDANGCQGTGSITIAENPNPTPTISGSDFCQGLSSTLDAGAGYNSYAWSSGGSSQTITTSTAGTYTVTVTDGNGCTGTDDITIAENPNPTPTISGNDFCTGQTETLDAGAGYTTYAWSPSGSTQTIDITTGGTYNVTVTDANGCEGNTSITITENPLPTPVISGNDFCNGNSETLTLANTYSNYTWNTSANTATITVNTSGTYSVTVTDANACEGFDDITLNALALPTPTITGNNFCAGTNSVLDAGTYSAWDWSTAETTQQITITTGGNYTVTVTDINGCQASANINITEYPLPTPSINGYDFCAGLSADIYTDAGYSSYVWNTTETTQLITVSTGGTYSVTVTDANSCQGSASIDITQYPLPTPVIVGNDFCNGSTESLYTATSYAGYQWNTMQTTPLITVNTGGTYAVTVTDDNGCEASASTTISVLPLPSPTIVGNDFCQNTNTDLDAGVYNAYDWNTNETSQTINIAAPGIYSVTVTDNNGCQGSDDISIAEIPSPTPNITGDLDVCEGESSVLDVGSGYSSYIWSTNSTSQSINVNTTNTYSVTVTDANGCEGSTSVNFTVHPNPTPDIDGLTAICQGDDASLDAGAGYNSYLWSTYETNQIINVSIAGQYAVTVTDENACDGNDLISVNVNNLAINITPGSTTICSGTNINISATVLTGVPTYTYNWSNGFNGSSQNVSPDITTTYSVYVVDGMGCVSETLSVTIDVTPGVQLDLFTNKDTICPGDPLLITSLVQYGIPPYTIYDENNNIVSLNYVTYPNVSGEFVYTVIDACNSHDVDTININLYPIPEINIQADVLNGCAPLVVHFVEGNAGDNYSYVWDFDDINDNNLSLSQTPTHTFTSSGTYDISVQITTDKGCKTEKTVYNMINVFPSPDAKFDVLPDVVTIIDPTFDFDNYSENAFSYIWNFDDGDTSNLFEPSHSYNYVGEYLVELIAISAQGCKDTAEHLVRVKDIFTLYVPTAFSPDNDGINDFFFVKGEGIDTDNFNLIIYDRWGEIIWQTDDYFAKWDGRAKAGDKLVEIGTYTWMVTCKDFEGNEHQKAGPVTVIR